MGCMRGSGQYMGDAGGRAGRMRWEIEYVGCPGTRLPYLAWAGPLHPPRQQWLDNGPDRHSWIMAFPPTCAAAGRGPPPALSLARWGPDHWACPRFGARDRMLWPDGEWALLGAFLARLHFKQNKILCPTQNISTLSLFMAGVGNLLWVGGH